jgi:DNA-binding GntR family transcriptional regulator
MIMLNLKQIKMIPVREQAAAVLREAILTKKLRAGDILTQNEVAKQLGVSSMPVREALQMLIREGFVAQKPNKAAVVNDVNRKFLEDYYKTRAILEGESAAGACCNGSDISEIRKAHEEEKKMVEEKRFHDYLRGNQMFHYAIWKAAGNERITNLLSSMWIGSPMGSDETEEAPAVLSQKEHQAIMEAIEARDPDMAGDLMRKHVIRSMETVLVRYD